MPDLTVHEAHRSEAYIAWVMDEHEICQLCGKRVAEQFMHPRRIRPWIGKVNGTWSQSKSKASDLGGLAGCQVCHDAMHRGRLVVSATDWDLLAVENLLAYAESLDCGTDLWAETVEWMQGRILEMEAGDE